jgi:hypothetical protein
MMKYVPSFLSNPHTIAGRTKDLWFKSNSLSLYSSPFCGYPMTKIVIILALEPIFRIASQ